MRTIARVALARVLLLLVALLLLAAALGAQTLAPTPKDPLESGWNLSINGGFSSITNQQTNNGFVSSVSMRLAQHWSARADVYVLADPSVTVALVGPEYRFSAAHLFKGSNTYAINAEKIEFFAGVGAGTARSTAQVGTPASSVKRDLARFAYAVGGGFDVKISDKLSVRPLDLKYIRSSMLGERGQVVGNHLQFSAGLGLRF